MNEYGTWSEWIWNEDYQKYYRQRQKPDGQYDFEWHGQTSEVDAAQTPRDTSLEDDLAQTLSETHIHSPSANYENQNPEYTVASGSGRPRTKPSSKGKSRRSKGKAPASHYDDENTEREAWHGGGAPSQHGYDAPDQQYYDYDPKYNFSHTPQQPHGQPHGMSMSAPHQDDALQSHAPLQQHFDHATQQYYEYPATPQQPSAHPYAEASPGYGYRQASHQAGAPVYGYPHPTQPGQQASAHAYPDEDPAMRQHYDHGHERRRRRRGGPTSPEPSPASELASRQYPEDYEEEEDPVLAAALRESRRYGQGPAPAGESSSSTYGSYDYEDEGPPTPKAGISGSHISATPGSEEVLDPRYRIEPSYKFGPGEIFKVLWSEPQGNANDTTPAFSERDEVRDKYGGRIYVGFRRFIVIANDSGHCTCVPILTYGGKACKKRGIKPEKHGIVYERGHRGKLLQGEPKLGFAPVKISLTEDGEKLSKESRVNYSKLVTVEHNVKVMFVGRIVASDWETVSEAVNKCWEDKIHHAKKHYDQ